MYLLLSHPYSADTPMCEGLPPVGIRQISDVSQGDVSNVFVVELCNHAGTHMDAPNHFNPAGMKIGQLGIESFIFSRPLCLEIPKGDAELVDAADLRPHAERIRECDLLLLQTGYGAVRTIHPERYRTRSPGLSREVALYITQEFPDLGAIGVDTISMACPEHLEEGLDAHRILFADPGRVILLIEDLRLEGDLSALETVWAIPLLIEGVDSAPCTVIGKTP